jgi:SET domain-containing protein
MVPGGDFRMIKFVRRGENSLIEYTVEEFEEATGLKYLSALEFENGTVLERIKTQCSRAARNGMISKESRWLGTLHADKVRNRVLADVSIRWIDETIGYGLFAESDMLKGDFIGEYTGVVRRCNLLFDNTNDYCFAYPTSVLTFKKHVIDSSEKGNQLRYANHSDTPNCEARGILVDGVLHIILQAIQDIPTSSEIRFEYSAIHWLSENTHQHFFYRTLLSKFLRW